MSESSMELAEYKDLSSDMADRIKNTDMQNLSITELAQAIKTKNITLTRVNRALIHVLLNIKKDLLQEYIDNDIVYYARVLGMKKEASHLIRKIKKQERLPIITKVSKAGEQLDALGIQMLNQDIFATHLYNQNLFEKHKAIIPNEYKHGVVIFP
jgi:predicted nucleotidyltransferase